jgi:spoIIIJ-associated protein
MSDIPLSEQEPTAVDFVTGLVDAFGADATVESEHLADDDAIEIRVEGDDLGLLVGPRGNTLASISELTRTAVAQQHSGRLEGRLRVDVAGYRARRKEALERFVGQVADKVLDTGSAVALEPMSPPDRKIVHDAVNEIDGVHTSSRGEDRRRHVVIHPDD